MVLVTCLCNGCMNYQYNSSPMRYILSPATSPCIPLIYWGERERALLLVMLTGLSFILCVVRRAAYPKLIQFNARNVYKIRIVQTQAPRVLQWERTAIFQQESPSHQGTEKTDCSVEESERELVVPLKPRNRERNG